MIRIKKTLLKYKKTLNCLYFRLKYPQKDNYFNDVIYYTWHSQSKSRSSKLILFKFKPNEKYTNMMTESFHDTSWRESRLRNYHWTLPINVLRSTMDLYLDNNKLTYPEIAIKANRVPNICQSNNKIMPIWQLLDFILAVAISNGTVPMKSATLKNNTITSTDIRNFISTGGEWTWCKYMVEYPRGECVQKYHYWAIGCAVCEKLPGWVGSSPLLSANYYWQLPIISCFIFLAFLSDILVNKLWEFTL